MPREAPVIKTEAKRRSGGRNKGFGERLCGNPLIPNQTLRTERRICGPALEEAAHAAELGVALVEQLAQLETLSGEELCRRRYEKFRRMGRFLEEGSPEASHSS